MSGIDFLLVAGVSLVVTLVLTYYQGFYRSIVRYMGMELIAVGLKVSIASAVVLGVIAQFSTIVVEPVRFAITYSTLCLLYFLGSRLVARYLLTRGGPGKERVIVYGAGEAGALLVLSMQDGGAYLPVALVDDKKSKQGKQVGGLRVHSRDNLPQLIEELRVSRILLALPLASRRRRSTILARLAKLNVHVQTIPDFNDLVTGKAKVDDIRDVEVEDLLGRVAVPPDQKLLHASVKGKVVMVTGAGGSIGSELCRQIIKLEQKAILLFDISEVALYNINKELCALSGSLDADCNIVPLIGLGTSSRSRAGDDAGIWREYRLPRRGLQTRSGCRTEHTGRCSQ
jgi:FlaA1/EpsC-like NDP-sugar epimerase